MNNEEITQEPPQQQRVLATSTRGDAVWNICQPVLDYLVKFGDMETSQKALKTRAYWEQEQQWIIDWGNMSDYFNLARIASHGIPEFKKMIATSAPETNMTTEYFPDGQEDPIVVDVVLYLALQAAERVMKKAQLTGKKIAGEWKRKKK